MTSILSADDLALIHDIENLTKPSTQDDSKIQPQSSLNQFKIISEQIKAKADDTQISFVSMSNCLEDLKRINASRLEILSKTSDFNRECTDLLNQRDFLVRVSSEVQSKFHYYANLSRVRNEIINLKLDKLNARKQFLPILSELEDCIMFFEENPHYANSEENITKFNEMLKEWLDFLVSMATETFQKFYSDADNFYQKAPEASEFHTIFTHLKQRRQHTAILDSIREVYFFIRLDSLIPSAEAAVTTLLEEEQNKSDLLRGSCELLQRMLNKESKVYNHYFGEENKYQISKYLKNALSLVSQRLYEVIRPIIIHENDVIQLSEFAQIIKSEFLQESIGFFNRVYQDIQQRIVFRVEIYINDTLTDDDTVLDKSLEILSLVYNRIDASIFQGLAQEVIDSCLYCFRRKISKAEDFFPAHVEVMQALEKLQSNISAMFENIEIQATTRDLDFTATKHLFWKLISGDVQDRGSWFEIVQEGAPIIQEKTLNSKDSISGEIQQTFNSLVIQIFKAVAKQMVLFLTRSRFSKLPYEEAMGAIEEGKAKMAELMPDYTSQLEEKLGNDKEKILISVNSLLFKAFQQVIQYITKTYPEEEAPKIIEFESLLNSPSENSE